MKAIIEMRRYDTTKADLIATWSNGALPGDFRRCEETAYLTKGGAWFLHGDGGALSKYAKPYEGGRGTIGSQEIIPLSNDEAAAWLATHDVEACEKHFPQSIKDA